MGRLIEAIRWVQDEEMYGTQESWEKAIAEFHAAIRAIHS